MNQPASDGSNSIKLTLAWLWVSIPLIWGIWVTLGNVVKLFQPPTA
jgi:hypothetical protein